MSTIAELAAAKKAAERLFVEACEDRSIGEEEYNRRREAYMAAMKAHHDALGFGVKLGSEAE